MRILIVEDDQDLCTAISHHLKRAGYEADICTNGGDALHYIRQQAYQLIILDRMLPELSGLEILSKMRSEGISTPVIITTALNGIGDRITGLDAGADDYLVKPFAMEELLARIRAVSRRPASLENPQQLTYCDVTLDLESATLTGPAGFHTLTLRECALLEILLRQSQRVIPRSVLLAHVWGPDAPVEDGNLDNYIHFLRRRLNTVGSGTKIRTARGVGYALESK